MSLLVCTDFHLDPREFDNFYEPFDVDANLGKVKIPDVWPKICEHFAITGARGYNFIQSWVSDYQSILPMHELVKTLATKYQLGILSNYYQDFFAECLRQKFIPDINFSPVIISAEVGCQKPDPKIYQIAEEQCGFYGADILFVDDKPENLVPATSLGWQTFLFDYHQPADSTDQLAKILL